MSIANNDISIIEHPDLKFLKFQTILIHQNTKISTTKIQRFWTIFSLKRFKVFNLIIFNIFKKE